MTTFALKDAFAYVGGHDFTGDVNALGLSCEGEQQDKTTFRSGGWREFGLGLKTSALNLAGFWQSAESDAVDPEVFDNLGTAGRVVTIADTETENMPAYMLQSMLANYQLFGALGEWTPFSVTGGCSDGVGVVRGFLAKKLGTVTAAGATGTALELGAVSATQHLYATFHVFGTPGTTITAVVESAAASGFVGATTRITFGPITAAGGTWGTRVAGSITDTFYRLRITAVTGTFSIACAVGIQ